MLLEMGIGDAYGAGFEFAKSERLKELKNDLSTYYKHNLPGNLKAGMYTDDTQMSIAIAEMMIDPTFDWSIEKIADKFVEVYKRDPRNGYSRKFQAVLDSVKTGDDLRAVVIPNSDRCGAAMRSVPLGYLKDTDTIMQICQVQASLTHNTSDGILSSRAVALTAHWILRLPLENVESFLKTTLKKDMTWTDWPKGQYVSTAGLDVARAAISAVFRNSTYSELLKECIEYTGDVDSVAAIAMGLASLACPSYYTNDLPANLYEDLENNGYGRDYLIELDKKLRDL